MDDIPPATSTPARRSGRGSNWRAAVWAGVAAPTAAHSVVLSVGEERIEPHAMALVCFASLVGLTIYGLLCCRPKPLVLFGNLGLATVLGGLLWCVGIVVGTLLGFYQFSFL